mgnify:CR=1 FL=1
MDADAQAQPLRVDRILHFVGLSFDENGGSEGAISVGVTPQDPNCQGSLGRRPDDDRFRCSITVAALAVEE